MTRTPGVGPASARWGGGPRPLRSATMQADTPTWVYLVELAVGAGCLAAGAGAFRRGLRLVAIALVIAAVAAVVHAGAALAS
jgi:hypothetical protein